MTKENMTQKDSKPVARIDYLYRGGVGESVEYTDRSAFYRDVMEQTEFGNPMRLVLYADDVGNTIPHRFIEKLDPPPKEVKVSLKHVPVYFADHAYARAHGEEDRFRTSAQANLSCKEAIEMAISDHYDGYVLDAGAYQAVVPEYGFQRTMCILAATIRQYGNDPRISHENSVWATSVVLPASEQTGQGIFLGNTHPGLVDLFSRMVRSRYLRTQALQEADIAAEASRIMNSFRNATEPNSPNGTHYMARVSEDFMARVRGQQTARLSRYFPFKTFHLTTLKGQKGLYAMISRNEDRNKPLRTPRTATKMRPSPGVER